MTDIDEILLFLVEEILGPHRPTREDNPQKYFHCKSPQCRHNHDKFHLAYNAEKRVFKCFKCETRGSIERLVSFYGNRTHSEKLKLALPYHIPQNYFDRPKVDYATVTCELPKEYLPLWKKRDSFKYRQALDYVMNVRKITMEQIKEYNIGLRIGLIGICLYFLWKVCLMHLGFQMQYQCSERYLPTILYLNCWSITPELFFALMKMQ